MVARATDPARPSRPRIAVSMGDPGGIGPEVIVKALADRSVRTLARFVIHGAADALHEAAHAAGVEPFWWEARRGSPLVETARAHDALLIDDRDDDRAGYARAPNRTAGELSFRWVEDAIASARLPAADPMRADAIVTGPISKEAWSLAGHGKYPGHTELLATRFGAKRHAMMFVGPSLRVVLASAHVPLMDLRNVLTIGRIHDAIDLGHEACTRLGIARPRIAVCGLNPHAGEHGLLGDEEERLIAPAIRIVAEQGMDVHGPFPADTIFKAAVGTPGRPAKYDLVVAMYHDQGLIPVKLLFRDESVNVTLGLPIVRTSPDHGTAFDIAGKNRADAGSMMAAIRLAASMARGKNERHSTNSEQPASQSWRVPRA
ncbi:MAG TPA: 4-hydroxythreonine-4-phosphate dehydrogenase PdxA [Phycisphaerales bacterium]|nr:4-hydroxythreonine-4-phosphate dehydrogenase PdxA [Phycisphaerales bacterium]